MRDCTIHSASSVINTQHTVQVLKQLKYVLHKRRANGASDRHKVQSLFKIARHLAGHASYMTQDTSHYREALKYIEGAIELQRSYR